MQSEPLIPTKKAELSSSSPLIPPKKPESLSQSPLSTSTSKIGNPLGGSLTQTKVQPLAQNISPVTKANPLQQKKRNIF